MADVQPDIDGFGDAVHWMSRIVLFLVEQGRSIVAATTEMLAKPSRNNFF